MYVAFTEAYEKESGNTKLYISTFTSLEIIRTKIKGIIYSLVQNIKTNVQHDTMLYDKGQHRT